MTSCFRSTLTQNLAELAWASLGGQNQTQGMPGDSPAKKRGWKQDLIYFAKILFHVSTGNAGGKAGVTMAAKMLMQTELY